MISWRLASLIESLTSIITTAPPLSALLIMMSSRLNRSFSATFSSLLKLGLIFFSGTVLLWSISFLTASTYVFIVWWLLGGVQFLFLFCLNSLFSSSFLLFGMSLKYAFSLIRLEKSFKSASSSFLLCTFGVGIKFKFLFKSLYSTLVNKCLVKLIIFPFGLDWCLIDFSIVFRKLLKFSWFLWGML